MNTISDTSHYSQWPDSKKLEVLKAVEDTSIGEASEYFNVPTRQISWWRKFAKEGRIKNEQIPTTNETADNLIGTAFVFEELKAKIEPDYKTDFQNLKKGFDDLTIRCSRVTTENKNLKSENENLKSENEHFKKTNSQLRKEILDLKESWKEWQAHPLAAELPKLQNELKILTQKNELLSNLLKTYL